MQKTKIDSRNLIISVVSPAFLVALAIENAIEHDKNYLQDNPGVVAMIRTLGLTEEQLGGKIVGAMKDVGRFDKTTTERVRNAEQYIGNVARFLSPTGRAWGIYLNCVLANAKPDALTQAQTEIFGHGEKVKPLMTLQGVTDFLNAAVRAEIIVNDSDKRTVAQLMYDSITSFGSPDNNVISALLPSAINSFGKLTQNTFVQVVRGLRHEAADPQTQVPETVIKTADEYLHVTGHIDGGQNGKRTQRQPRA